MTTPKVFDNILFNDLVILQKLREHDWYAIPGTGKLYDTFGNEITGGSDSKGYVRIKSSFRGKEINVYLHRIIWIAANEQVPPSNYEIDHLNGIKNDNRIENLNLCSHVENCHNQNAPNVRPGELHPQAKLTNEIASEIRDMRNKTIHKPRGRGYMSDRKIAYEIGKKYNIKISHQQVSRIIRGICYSEAQA